jgi:hypothetical protein
MLSGRVTASAARQVLGAAQAEIYDHRAREIEALIGRGVRPDDVVVVSDPIAAALAEAVRELGGTRDLAGRRAPARRARRARVALHPALLAGDRRVRHELEQTAVAQAHLIRRRGVHGGRRRSSGQ